MLMGSCVIQILARDTMNKFNEAYFEDGVKQKLSGYENYRYMPTRSYEEAITLVENFDLKQEEYTPLMSGGLTLKTKSKTVLDLGCAKGFLVHALNQLGILAFGEDISEYAILNCKQTVWERLSLPTNEHYGFIICKDMMEHISEKEVLNTLTSIRKRCQCALFVIPLGDDDRFRIREYEIDVTHVTKKDEDWWIDILREAGFKLDKFSYELGAIKKKWTSKYPYGNGFFQVSSK